MSHQMCDSCSTGRRYDSVDFQENAMNRRKQMLACMATLCLMAWVSSFETAAQQQGAGAQGAQPAPPAAPPPAGGRGNFVPEPVPPPQNFATSKEHYDFLHRLHKGGTRHTYESIPKWEGLWSAAGNTSSSLFRADPCVRGGIQEAASARRRLRPVDDVRAGRLSAMAARTVRA
jgi:hypothetical protein